MTVYDAAMVGLVLIGMLWGAWKGAVWQAAGLISLGLGYAVAHPGSLRVAPYLAGDPVTRRMGAMLLLYVLTSGGVFMVAWVIRSFLRKIRLEAYDRHLGMLLGGAGGVAIGLVGTLFVTSLAPDTRPMIFHSVSGKLAAKGLATLETRLPAEARAELAPFWSGEEGAEIAEAASETDGEPPARVALQSKKVRDAAADDVPPPHRSKREVGHEDDASTPARHSANPQPVARHRSQADEAETTTTPSNGDPPRFGRRASRWLENVGRTLTHTDSEDPDADARRR